jgi:NADPH-dependent glutamate synthase beta subunit-like oxidoreductase
VEGTFVLALSDRYGGPAAEEVAARLEQPDLADIRALVSWRGVVARPDVCFVSLAADYLSLIQRESCGRCTPCRIGTHLMLAALERLKAGKGAQADIDLLRAHAEMVEGAAWCGVANTIREPMLALLDAGTDHFAAHAAGQTCAPEQTLGWVTAPCRSTCPSNVDCPWYIFQVAEGHPFLATSLVKQDNPLPATIGRTCHHPCETNCTLQQVGEPIAINWLKRWAADRAEGIVEVSGGAPSCDWSGAVGPHEAAEASAVLAEGDETPPVLATAPSAAGRPVVSGWSPDQPAEADAPLRRHSVGATGSRRGARVAIVGAGPAGLSAGHYLARLGYSPTIFEALPVPGGMLYVGIPEYRLPKAHLRREVELIEHEGVEIRYNQAVGRDVAFSDLETGGFEATFLAIGAHSGKKLRIPGEDLSGSMDAIDFLRQVALGQETGMGKKVLVLGGGNSAMDAARTALRLGAETVTVVYRRAREQMPANPWEVDEAEEEGVAFHFLAAPVSCGGDVCVQSLACQPMELGPPDASGRRSPVPLDCEPFVLDADTIIAAVGQQPDFDPFAVDPAIRLNKWGYLEMDARTFMTTKPGVFVGGDAVTGGSSVIEAIYAGKIAARQIHRFLSGLPVVEEPEERLRRLAVYLGAQSSWYPLAADSNQGSRQPMPMLAPEVRVRSFAHNELGYTDMQAHAEAKRCLRCHRPLLVAG